MKRILITISLVLISTSAYAQSANITTYTLETYAPGVTPTSGQPIQVQTYTANSAVCNQTAPSVPGNVVNPTQFFFDDAAVPGKVCIIPLTGQYLPSLPNAGGYTIYVMQTDNLGQTSARSAVSNPFGKQGTPITLTNVKIR